MCYFCDLAAASPGFAADDGTAYILDDGVRPWVGGGDSAGDPSTDAGYAGASSTYTRATFAYGEGISGTQTIDALLVGRKWASGVTQSYSFPTAASNYGTAATYGGQEVNGFIAYNDDQKAAARYAFKLISNYTLLSPFETTETDTAHARHRLAQTNATTGTPPVAVVGSATGDFPGDTTRAGDIWFGRTGQPFYTTPALGNWGFATQLHEVGHTMGLKHGHQAATYVGNTQVMTAARDNQAYSLMTYNGNPVPFGGTGQPQTYMMDDIAALQYMYGAWYGYNSGNSVYTFNTSTGEMSINGTGQGVPTGNIVFRTVWDGGGEDTYDLSNYTSNLKLNLNAGEFLDFGVQKAGAGFSNVGNSLLVNGNVGNLIENAIGGSGNDELTGNQANNVLEGGRGFNTIVGGAGVDTAVMQDSRYYYARTDITGYRTFSGFGPAASETDKVSTDVERFKFKGTTQVTSNAFEPGGGTTLARNDDGSSSVIDLSTTFLNGLNFYGRSFNQLYVNNNGNVTFGSSLSTYTPTVIGGSSTAPIIAPFWADVDTRGTGPGTVSYRLDPSRGALTVTWQNVDYYSTGSSGHQPKSNSFQLQIIDQGSGDFEMIFRYNGINWTTGDASGGSNGLGGTVARAGFSSGTGVGGTYYELPSSGRQNEVLALGTAAGNTGVAGAWQFRVSNGAVRGLGTTAADVINGSSAAEFFDSAAGDDTILALGGDDHAYARVGNDAVFLGDGADYGEGGDGADTVDGGEGDDTIYGDNFSTDNAGLNAPLVSGTDEEGNPTDLGADPDKATAGLEAAPASAAGPGDGADFLTGGTGNDRIYGGGGNDYVDGGTGDDRLFGDDGADTIVGGDGGDTIYGGAGGDVIYADAGSGADGADIVRAGAGDDTVIGGAGADQLYGDDGGDTLYGGDGDDFIDGGAGLSSSLNGGTGNDVIYGGAGDDYEVGAEGDDVLVGGLSGQDSLYGGEGNDYIIAGDGVGSVLDGGAGANSLWGGAGNDYVVGGEGGDIVVGGGGSDYLFALDGADGIYGGGGTDYVFGGGGNDFIYTDDIGSSYADYVYAGPGTGVDTVADFTAGDGADHDTLVISGTSQTYSSIMAGAQQVGVYTVISVTPTDQVYLYNVQPFQLTANNFIFL